MKYNRDLIIKELGLVRFGQKGWLRNKDLSCPVCHKNDKFGIMIGDNKAKLHCFYGCDTGSFNNYIKLIGRPDLLQVEEDIDIREKISSNLGIVEEELDLTMEPKRLPIGYKRIYDLEYLNNRGFVPADYLKYEVGMTSIDPRYKNKYIIFPLRDNLDECVGFIARSMYSKSWHDENLRLSKLGKVKLVLRYDNSLNTDFIKYLYGEHEITLNTETVILTEGIFSKKAVDDKLELDSAESVKCCATFGQNVSPYHIKKLLDKRIKNIILLYDNGTIQSTKSIAMNLTNYFKVKIGYIKQEGKDPDDISQNELLDVMLDLRDPFDFYVGKISSRLKN